MLKIAICDDDKILCEQLYTIFENNKSKFDAAYATDVYYDADSLIKKLDVDAKYYDLIFLDIQLGETDGIDAGKLIREKYNDGLTKIVYMSSHEKYAMQLFEVRTFDFLVKPFDESKVISVFTEFLKTLEQAQSFYYSIGSCHYRVPLNEILYFEITNRKAMMVTKDQSVEFYSSMKKIVEQVKQGRFILVHNSFFVNFDYIDEYSYKELTMANGAIIGISQPYRKTMRAMFLDITNGDQKNNLKPNNEE